jgi:clan AA aspartic protease (TIGR02281 family)
MPQLFTVRWPFFARLEAVLLFPVAVRLASEIAPLRAFINRMAVPAMAPFGARVGAPKELVFWTAMALAAAVPWFVLLIVADRFLTVRKGFAVLSVIAIALWAWSAHQLSGLLMPLLAGGYLPRSLLDAVYRLPANQRTAAVAGGIALFLHLRALWTGLRDDGEVAARLLDARHGHAQPRAPVNQARKVQDLYYRQTASFRDWGPPGQIEFHGARPRENSAGKVLTAITWIGVTIGVGAAYHAWNNAGVSSQHSGKSDLGPAMSGGGVKATSLVAAGTVNAGAPAPVVQGATGMPPASAHTANAHAMVNAAPAPVASMPLPSVQRPTEISTSVQSTNGISGPNEAVAERDSDGGFAFDAVVNGSHVRMLFDTGASVVGLRAEDAVHLGIPMARLTYSAKIKTANGTAEVAPVMIDTMMIGNITLRNVSGFVAKEGTLQENLLGQTFLARLSGFNVEKNLLVLRGR